MKFLYLLFTVLIATAAGYLTEPSLRVSLTGKSADSEKLKKTSKKRGNATSQHRPELGIPSNPPVEPLTPTPVVQPPTPVEPTPTPVTPTPTPVVPTIPEVVDIDPPVTLDPFGAETPETPKVQPETLVKTADVVAVMKASIASRQISKFTASQVLDWQAGTSTETFDGVAYQIGNVTYQAETPFGTKNLPAKALIKDGKVVRWISPKSGMQIE
jgi:hypothetical protein